MVFSHLNFQNRSIFDQVMPTNKDRLVFGVSIHRLGYRKYAVFDVTPNGELRRKDLFIDTPNGVLTKV